VYLRNQTQKFELLVDVGIGALVVGWKGSDWWQDAAACWQAWATKTGLKPASAPSRRNSPFDRVVLREKKATFDDF